MTVEHDERTAEAPRLVCSDPVLDPDTLGRAIVAGSAELVVVIDEQLRLVATNPVLPRILGVATDELLGCSPLEHIAAEDIDRAATLLAMVERTGSSPMGASPFTLVAADGTRTPVLVTGTDLEIGGRRYVAIIGRLAYVPGAVDRILDGMLDGSPLDALLDPVLEIFAWRETGSRVAIAWTEGGELRAVSTGLPGELSGARPLSPWAGCRADGASVAANDLSALHPAVRARAEELGLTGYWIEPVADPVSGEPALVTLWTAQHVFPPASHSYGMHTARRYVDLVLQWNDRSRRLEQAARHDPLTGLANRRALHEALAHGDRGGAVLYCDLDDLKTVNDEWGHAAGDALLVTAARRLEREVRDGDLVARIGGDEFAVVLWGASEQEAADVADRIRLRCGEEVVVEGHRLPGGMSVGVGHATGTLGDEVLEAADRALYADKRSRGPFPAGADG